MSTSDYEKHKDAYKARAKLWRLNNPDKARERRVRWRAANPGRVLASCAAQRASRLHRTPKWADLKEIAIFYEGCPAGHHVDHVIPLRGKYVSGLHVFENLQYVPAEDNLSKGNRHESDEWNTDPPIKIDPTIPLVPDDERLAKHYAYIQKWREDHREELRLYYRTRRKENIEERRAYEKEWYKKNKPTKVIAAKRRYRETHAEQIAEYDRQRYQKDPDKHLKRRRDWYARNKDHAKTTRKSYEDANRDKIQAYDRLRYAKKKQAQKEFIQNLLLIAQA